MLLREEGQAAFLLHRRSLRETSLLLDLFTREHGRVAAVARGARGRAKGASYQPFQPLLISWTGRGELKTLVSAECATIAPMLVAERLFSAMYLNEMLVRLLPVNDAHEAVFDAYAAVLNRLAVAEDIEPVLRAFELLLLCELGYGLDLVGEAGDGAVLEPQAHYVYQPDAGLRRATTVDTGVTYPGWVLTAMDRRDFSDRTTCRYAKRLLRDALAFRLGSKPLLSRELFTGGAGDPARRRRREGE